ncbi:hypothetical protein [Tranquillimonas alkanivorans]|uniref:DUF1127 domain-containing protein n=1 Tax=Tranquillimonas alkanivorans TaxID=441119 RepID=A0A1I5REQ1_9RHOB|nr:hypothetical protein [Tranquillimonas alkanivorans]SFP56791.1 hypothetical protein SAMN04488047_108131 [Tranquillimonas alkanivorans]
MKTMIHSLRAAAARRAAYKRTRREIASMPLGVAHDLDIDPTQSSVIARNVVYGR